MRFVRDSVPVDDSVQAMEATERLVESEGHKSLIARDPKEVHRGRGECASGSRIACHE